MITRLGFGLKCHRFYRILYQPANPFAASMNIWISLVIMACVAFWGDIQFVFHSLDANVIMPNGLKSLIQAAVAAHHAPVDILTAV